MIDSAKALTKDARTLGSGPVNPAEELKAAQAELDAAGAALESAESHLKEYAGSGSGTARPAEEKKPGAAKPADAKASKSKSEE